MTSVTNGSQVLPTLNNINNIKISSSTLDTISITDTQKVSQIVNFLNQYQSGWSIPEKSRPEASLTFSFFSGQEHVTDIGVSAQFISQLYGKHWSQPIDRNVIKKFAGSTHPAIEENLFPIIPVDENSQNEYSYWKQKLGQLKTGSNYHKIKLFIRDNNIRIKHINIYNSDNNYWLNLELSMVNDGDYIDTIIAAKIFLNSDHSLKSIQFLGYQLAKKTSPAQRITSNLKASSY